MGVGKGRNYAFSKATGEYVYFLDDDAYIDTNQNPEFFIKAIQVLDNNESIKTLTTQIFDLLWKENRVVIEGPAINEELYKCYRFCGGSHFLRKSFFSPNDPYFPNKYGLEEIFPSLRVVDNGGLNVYIPTIRVIHNPKFNKWTSDNKDLLVTEVASKYAMKSMIYPTMTIPILYVAFITRALKSLGIKSFIRTYQRIKEVKSSATTKRISYSTIKALYKDYGLSIF